jgi:uncharacterized protein
MNFIIIRKTIHWTNGEPRRTLLPMTTILMLLVLGSLAGLLTTVAGLGGGLLLLLALSLLWDPHQALAATAIALLVGNLHRAFILRRSISRKVVGAFAIGAVPGSIAGGWLAVAVPAWVVQTFMVGSTVLSIVHALSHTNWRPGPNAIAPAGVLIGGLTGTSGGAAVLTSPLFLAAGLSGEAYVASLSASAVLMHVGRIVAYGAGGLVTTATLGYAALLALAILGGNLAGRKLRTLSDKLPARSLEYASLVVCATLAVLGFGR